VNSSRQKDEVVPRKVRTEYIMTKELKEIEKQVQVDWSYPAIPKPIFACRIRHKPTDSYIHTNSKNQFNGYVYALELIAEQMKGK
jgi:hypothetical protein